MHVCIYIYVCRICGGLEECIQGIDQKTSRSDISYVLSMVVVMPVNAILNLSSANGV
jgi:hypothetical protein